MLSEKLVEIMEAVWCAAEKNLYNRDAIRQNCTVAFDEAQLDDLEQRGLITKSGDTILFTAAGKTEAEGIMRRHRLAEVLVSSILKLKKAEMEEVACQVEHALLPEVEASICTLLGHPELCPDGRPIPRGACCRNLQKTVSTTVVSLAELGAGESGRITYIKPENHASLHQLLSFGLEPGVTVTVLRTTPALCLMFENTELALDRDIAGNIFVWKTEGKKA
ncbi:MAG: metal-dependent transcriptional regulator [Deltaproteobacteria bacterium]|nr:metal-dependent transcriptional regulator [Deltaproteobacteria bacterium]